MFGIFARARRYQSLTPTERAALRLLEGLSFVAVVGAAAAATQYLAGPLGADPSAVDWPVVVHVCAAGAAVAVLMALAKYFKAHGDPLLGDVLAAVGERVGAAAGTSPAAGAPPAAGDAGAPPAAPPGPTAAAGEAP